LLQVKTVPSISILDAEGRLRLAGAGSLLQVLEYKMDVEAAIRRVSSSGALGTYGLLPKYYPVRELVGQRCPDFEAALLGGDDVGRWSRMIDPDNLNVLVFWSVDCPHCRKSVPAFNRWIKQSPGIANVATVVKASNEAMRVQTEEFCKSNGIVFPTFVDESRKIADRYSITSTPTVLLIDPDGVIDSVILSGEIDLGDAISKKKQQLQKGAESSGS
jgi:thiol-disulfide isomerase/thioredoxin